MPQTTTAVGQSRNQGQVIVLDSRKPEQVVSDKQYMKILQMSDLLSRHLSARDIIDVFTHEIQGLIPHSSYRYTNKLSDNIRHGTVARYSLHYHLTIQNMDLGEITLYRSEPFSSNEVCQFEDLLCSLVFPLKNALLYQDALASAYRDPLTGINNRAAMNKLLPREVKLAKRYDQKLAMLMMDLDGFKQVNDTHGHSAGDRLLQDISDLIVHNLRDTDMLFRFGGDEFVAALPQTEVQGAIDVGNRILDTIKDYRLQNCDEQSEVGISIGLSMLHAGDDYDRFFKRVDQAMYKAKRSGKHQIVVA